MREHLRGRPEHVAETPTRNERRRHALLAHRHARDQHFKRDVEVCARGIGEIRQRLRIFGAARRTGHAERFERIADDDPRRHGRREVLRQERTERLVFPLLNIARRPIVHEREAEDAIPRIRDGNRRTKFIRTTDEEANLEFVVHQLRWTKGRRTVVVRNRLTMRPNDRCAARHKRTRATVVTDRNVLPVWQKRIRWPEHRADVRRVMERRVEIGVVADDKRHRWFALRSGTQQPLDLCACG